MSPTLKVILLGCLAIAVLGSEIKTNKNDLAIGTRVWGDNLIQRLHVQKPSSFLRVIKDTRTLSGDGISKITQIVLTDQSKDGDGGKVSLINGGPDFTYATIEFKSKRSHGIDFLVEVYGTKVPTVTHIG